MAKLGDICTIQSGGTPSRSNKEYWENGTIPWVKISDFSGKYLYHTSEKITQAGLEGSSAKVFTKGTILYTIFATLGETCILDIDATTNQAIAGLKLNDDSVLLDYLYYYLLSKKEDVNEIGRGVAQNNINMKILREMEIAIPPKEEQNKTTDILNNVYELIALRKEQLAKLDQLVKSRFIELFGDPVVNPKFWDTAPLSALIVNANNGMARRGKDADGSIVLRLVELQNGFIDYTAPNRICLNDTEKKRYALVDNDFLFARVNGNPDYVGRCAVFKSIDEHVFHNDHIIRVHFDEAKINGCFMSVLLNSDYGKRQMREQIKTSAGQYTISQDGIGAIMAILPPLELQNQFATFVEQTDKSKLEIQKSLEKLETLKKALMQKYFG